MPKVDFRLNALVDAGNLDGEDLAGLALQAALNGATLIQYRDKNAPTGLMVERARAIRSALAATDVPLVVNDRIDVALAAGADGVHIGRDDMSPADARRLLGASAIIGLTVKNGHDADTAIASPIDYACIGGVFATLSKVNPDPPVGLHGFRHLAGIIRAGRPGMPIGAIAGIGLETVGDVVAAGADGIAVISAIFRAGDVALAAQSLRDAVDRALAERRA